MVVEQTYHVSDTAANWAMFLCGTKSIIKAALVDIAVQDEEFIAVKHWIYYYEVLSRFSLMHWLNEPELHYVCHENLSDRIIAREVLLPKVSMLRTGKMRLLIISRVSLVPSAIRELCSKQSQR
jgi:hypothetical protein